MLFRSGLFRDGDRYPKEYERVANEVYAPYYLRFMKKVPRELQNLNIAFDVYRQLWGEAGEFRVTGEIRDWDAFRRLHRIRVPTLVLAGRYDQATPESALRIAGRIPQGECLIFERSGHFPFIDQRKLFLAAIEDFLTGT